MQKCSINIQLSNVKPNYMVSECREMLGDTLAVLAVLWSEYGLWYSLAPVKFSLKAFFVITVLILWIS